MIAQQPNEAAEGTTARADNQSNAGALPPLEKPAESAKTEGKPKESVQTESPEQKPESAAEEKDPLTDTSSPEYAQVKELQARDTEVRAHEQAHLSAAGQYATGGATYSYQTGPDGQQYAIGGEVGIDVSAIPDDPQATIAKMEVVQRAAMAPAEPSGQDVRVAAQAAQTASAARAQLASQQLEKMQGGGEPVDDKVEAGNKSETDEAPRLTATEKEAQHSYLSHQKNEETGRSFEATA